MRLGLGTRLALLCLAAGLLPVVAALGELVPREQEEKRAAARLALRAEAEALAARIDGALGELLGDVRSFGAGARGGSERQALARFLRDKHPELTAVALTAADRVVAEEHDAGEVTPDELAAFHARARGLGAGATRASDFYAVPARRELRVTLVTPLPPDAAVAAEVSLRRVQTLVAAARVGGHGLAYVVDAHGRLVAHLDLPRALARAAPSDAGEARALVARLGHAPAAASAEVSEFVLGERAEVAALAPLGLLGWGLVVAAPRAEAYGFERTAWGRALGAAALALGIALGFALTLARDLGRSLARLGEAARELTAGDFGRAVPADGPPEVAALGHALDEASRRLAGFEAENRELVAAVERGYVETLRALVNAIEAKDPYTAGHSQRTAEIAVAIGHSLGLDAEALRDLEVGGLLHDIGKIGVPEAILRKPAPLDDAEMGVMRGHAAIGHGIVGDIALLARAAPMVRHHHERWNGSGYPDGLRGEAIPLGARIISVADTYDAITSDRCYQPGQAPAQAVPILLRLRGVQLDPALVEALLRALGLSPGEASGDGAELTRGHRPTLELATFKR